MNDRVSAAVAPLRHDVGAGLAQPAGECLVDPRFDEQTTRPPCAGRALRRRDGSRRAAFRPPATSESARPGAARGAPRRSARLSGSSPPSVARRHENRRRARARRCAPAARAAAPGSSRSILLKTSSFGPVVHLELVEHLLDDDALLLPRRRARVDDVQQEIGFARLLERRAERRDEMVRQLSNEPDGVGEQHVRVIAEIHVARERIERGEQPVLDEHVLRPTARAGSTTCRRWCSRRSTP